MALVTLTHPLPTIPQSTPDTWAHGPCKECLPELIDLLTSAQVQAGLSTLPIRATLHVHLYSHGIRWLAIRMCLPTVDGIASKNPMTPLDRGRDLFQAFDAVLAEAHLIIKEET